MSFHFQINSNLGMKPQTSLQYGKGKQQHIVLV